MKHLVVMIGDFFESDIQLSQALGDLPLECLRPANFKDATTLISRRRPRFMVAEQTFCGEDTTHLVRGAVRVVPSMHVMFIADEVSAESFNAAIKRGVNEFTARPNHVDQLVRSIDEKLLNPPGGGRDLADMPVPWGEAEAAQVLRDYLAIAVNSIQESAVALARVSDRIAGHGGVSGATENLLPQMHLVGALRETIMVLEKTRNSFKSTELRDLRLRLEQLVRNPNKMPGDGGLNSEGGKEIPRLIRLTD